MAAVVPDQEPDSLVAGDTVVWTKSLSDYPSSDGWALTYAFRLQQGSGLLDVTASAATPFVATITATQSASMKVGVWVWAAYATKAAERYQVDSGSTTVLPNLAKIDFSIDLRSPTKVAYDNALSAWQGVKLGKTVSLNGRVYTQHDLTDLIAYVDRCKADYNLEVASQDGGSRPTRIGVAFRRV